MFGLKVSRDKKYPQIFFLKQPLVILNIAAAIDEVETEVDECADTMHYCDSMGKYCDNIEYQGVRLYCRKTCKSCDEEIVPQNNATTSENAEGAGDSCKIFRYDQLKT